MSADDDRSLVTARIIIQKQLDDADEVVTFRATTGDGESPLPLVEILGMLRLSEDTAIREAMQAGDD